MTTFPVSCNSFWLKSWNSSNVKHTIFRLIILAFSMDVWERSGLRRWWICMFSSFQIIDPIRTIVYHEWVNQKCFHYVKHTENTSDVYIWNNYFALFVTVGIFRTLVCAYESRRSHSLLSRSFPTNSRQSNLSLSQDASWKDIPYESVGYKIFNLWYPSEFQKICDKGGATSGYLKRLTLWLFFLDQ